MMCVERLIGAGRSTNAYHGRYRDDSHVCGVKTIDCKNIGPCIARRARRGSIRIRHHTIDSENPTMIESCMAIITGFSQSHFNNEHFSISI